MDSWFPWGWLLLEEASDQGPVVHEPLASRVVSRLARPIVMTATVLLAGVALIVGPGSGWRHAGGRAEIGNASTVLLVRSTRSRLADGIPAYGTVLSTVSATPAARRRSKPAVPVTTIVLDLGVLSLVAVAVAFIRRRMRGR